MPNKNEREWMKDVLSLANQCWDNSWYEDQEAKEKLEDYIAGLISNAESRVRSDIYKKISVMPAHSCEGDTFVHYDSVVSTLNPTEKE
jgi:hypothetical protein